MSWSQGNGMMLLRFADQEVACKGLIFDKDCTLTDSIAMWPELITRRARKLVAVLDLPEDFAGMLCKVMGLDPVSRKVCRQSPLVVGSRLETAAAVAGLLYLHFGLPWDSLIDLVSSQFDASDLEMGLDKQSVPFPGMVGKLQQLHQAGYTLAVATNDSYHRTAAIMKILKLSQCFSVLACADLVANPKPNPEMIHYICTETGLQPRDFILIGDSLLDIKMGKQAGVKLNVGVLTGACTKEQLQEVADCVVDCVTDFEILE